MEWISVEDRLPEKAIEVLIKEAWVDEIQIAYNLDGEWYEQHVNHICNGNAMCDFEIDGVTHWAKLPKPPK